MPSYGWTQGWFGRRDRALLVLAHHAALPYRQITRLKAGDVAFTPAGAAVITTPTTSVVIPAGTDAAVCAPCILTRWIRALDLANQPSPRPVAQTIDRASEVTDRSPHRCTTPRPHDHPTTAQLPLLPPADQWGAILVDLQALTARSLSDLTRGHGHGQHTPHRPGRNNDPNPPLPPPRPSRSRQRRPPGTPRPTSRPRGNADKPT